MLFAALRSCRRFLISSLFQSCLLCLELKFLHLALSRRLWRQSAFGLVLRQKESSPFQKFFAVCFDWAHHHLVDVRIIILKKDGLGGHSSQVVLCDKINDNEKIPGSTPVLSNLFEKRSMVLAELNRSLSSQFARPTSN